MGISAQFESIVDRQLNVHAAWVPVTTPFKLGDYGLISDGVFKKLGNITNDFGISFTQETGQDASLSFVSEDTIVVDANTGAEINLNPSGDLKANVTFRFQRDKSFLVKAPVINVSLIENVNQVALKLKQAKEWHKKFKVVYQVYVAKKPLIVCTNEGGTDVTISAEGSALKQFNVGTASASFSLKTNRALGLEISGETGVIALGLFRLNFLTGKPKFMGGEVEKEIEQIEFLNGEKLPDDL